MWEWRVCAREVSALVATKICTAGGACITCGSFSAEEIKRLVEAEEKAGSKDFGGAAWDKTGGIRIDQIATITEVREDEEEEESDDDRRPLFGSPEVVIFTGG